MMPEKIRHKTYFLSDAHLGAKYINDPRRHEQRVVSLLETMGRDAEAIYLLGDILDFWFEYHHVVPKGHIRLFGTIARLTDSGVRVYWLKGNHDMWTYSYLHDELGVEIIEDSVQTTIHGKNFFLSHGDNLGKQPRPYRIMRSVFRSPFWQRVGCSLHPSWLIPFAFRWSSHNRTRRGEDIEKYLGDENEQQMQFAINYAAAHPEIDYFITGHRHVAIDRPVPDSRNARLICLGDFFRQFTYAEFDGNNNVVLKHYVSNA